MSNDNATPIDPDVQQTTEQEAKRYFLLFRSSSIVTPDIPNYDIFDAIGSNYRRFELSELDNLDLDNPELFDSNADDGRRIVLFTMGVNTSGLKGRQLFKAYQNSMNSAPYDPLRTKMALIYKFQKRRGRVAKDKAVFAFTNDGMVTVQGLSALNTIKESIVSFDFTERMDVAKFAALNALKGAFDAAVYKIGLELGYVKKRGRKM